MNKELRFSGIVKKNLGRGRDLGFPTANIEAPKDIVDGLYLGYCHSGPNDSRACLIFIGASETFGETDRKAEIYILEFFGDLYGQEIEVEIIKKLRNNIKFSSQDELIEQMKEDEWVAKEFFKSYNLSN